MEEGGIDGHEAATPPEAAIVAAAGGGGGQKGRQGGPGQAGGEFPEDGVQQGTRIRGSPTPTPADRHWPGCDASTAFPAVTRLSGTGRREERGEEGPLGRGQEGQGGSGR